MTTDGIRRSDEIFDIRERRQYGSKLGAKLYSLQLVKCS